MTNGLGSDNSDQVNAHASLDDSNLAQYARLLDKNKWRLAFPSHIENAYQHFIKKDFIETNKFTVAFGVLFYASFLVIDQLFYDDLHVAVTIARVLICVFAGVLLSAIFFKQSIQHVLSTTLFCAILMGLQVVGSAIFYFQQPYNLLYAIGVLPIIVFGILVFRFSFKHTVILVVSLFGAYMVHVIQAYPFVSGNAELQEVLNVASPIMLVFMAAICLMGLYMSYAVDKLNRSDWLKNNIMRIESDKLNKVTEKLETLSITDGLTGLYNRRYFDETLQTQWQKSRDTTQPLSVVMLDLDWFKPYNDHYGHQQGDTCLQRVSQCFLEACKSIPSTVARYGGEEFIILLPNMDSASAQQVAKRICHCVYAQKITHAGSPFGFCSVSLGVHTVYPSKATGESGMGQFLKDVDIALYQAKSQGKNQMRVYADIS